MIDRKLGELLPVRTHRVGPLSWAAMAASLCLVLSTLGAAGAAGLSRPIPSGTTLDAPTIPRASAEEISEATDTRATEAYGLLPVSFVPNAGQTDPSVRYLVQGAGYGFYFADDRVTIVLTRPIHGQEDGRGVALELRFLGADPDARPEVTRTAAGVFSYFLGDDPNKWQRALPTYGELAYRDLWPGVDLVFRGAGGQLKYEFLLEPGARVRDIRLAYAGAEGLSVDGLGNLIIKTPLGSLTDTSPVSYRVIEGERAPVESHFVLGKPYGRDSTFGFAVGAGYDSRRPFVIDPGLLYSTFLGGALNDAGHSIAIDPVGNAHVTGTTFSTDFPTTLGAFDTTDDMSSDAFVTKLNPTGSALVYSTYLGGSGGDAGFGIVLDSAGNAYVTGSTTSMDFPTTVGAFDTSHNAGNDAFVTKVNPTGSALVYSTYVGGSLTDVGSGIALDSAGNAHLIGSTNSGNYPTTSGALDSTFGGGGGSGDAFVTKLNPTGSALVYSTYLGGSSTEGGFAIALDSAGNAHVTGRTFSTNFPTTSGAFDTTHNGVADAFVAALNPTGSALVYSTYLGDVSGDEGLDIALDSAGSAHVSGFTSSQGFPTTASAFDTSPNGGDDAFVTKLNPTGSALVYSTYLGGSGNERASTLALDPAGNAHVAGFTSSNFPTTAGAFDTTPNGASDAFVSKLNAAGSTLVYSTFLGGPQGDQVIGVALDLAGHTYVTGATFAGGFPTTPGAFDTSFGGVSDAFVAELDTVGLPATVVITPLAATNPTGTIHPVTATVTDVAGQPVPGMMVRFGVTGAHATSGSCTTGVNGQCTFTYSGTVVGPDTIHAYADLDTDNMQDLTEPFGDAAKMWTLPTPGCPPGGGDEDEDDDGLEDTDESLFDTLLGVADSDGDGVLDGNDDSDGDGEDDEDEDDGTEGECPNDSDGDGEDDEDEDDEDGKDED